MKRTKRKYTRRQALVVPSTTIEESKSRGIETGSSIIPQRVVDTPIIDREFTFSDLPLSLRIGVENAIKMRKRLKLPDDSKERKSNAVRYFRGERPR